MWVVFSVEDTCSSNWNRASTQHFWIFSVKCFIIAYDNSKPEMSRRKSPHWPLKIPNACTSQAALSIWKCIRWSCVKTFFFIKAVIASTLRHFNSTRRTYISCPDFFLLFFICRWLKKVRPKFVWSTTRLVCRVGPTDHSHHSGVWDVSFHIRTFYFARDWKQKWGKGRCQGSMYVIVEKRSRMFKISLTLSFPFSLNVDLAFPVEL